MLESLKFGVALLASLLLSTKVLQAAGSWSGACSTEEVPAAVPAASVRLVLDDATILVQISQEQSQGPLVQLQAQPGGAGPAPVALVEAGAQRSGAGREEALVELGQGLRSHPSALVLAVVVSSLSLLATCTGCWLLHRSWEQQPGPRPDELRSRAEELRARAAELRQRASEVLASGSVGAPGATGALDAQPMASEEPKAADTPTGIYTQVLAPLVPVIPVLVLGALAAGLCESKESAISLSSFDAVDTRAASEESKWGRIISTFTYTAVQVFLGPALGVASDSWGRRPVIMTCKALAVLQTLAAALHVYYEVSLYPAFALEPLADLPVTTLLIVWAIDRLGGSYLCLATGLGFLFGTKHFFQFAGLMSGFAMTLQQAFGAKLAADLLCLALIALALPESLPADRRRPLEWPMMVPGVGMRSLHWSGQLVRLTAVAVLATLCDEGFEAEARRHLKRDFQWDDTASSVGLVIFQGSAILWLACGLGPLVRRFGEVGSLAFARWASLLYAVSFLLASEAWQIWIVDATLQGPAALTFPAMVLLCSTFSAPDEQGAAQGSLHAVVSLVQGLGPSTLLLMFKPDTSSERSASILSLFTIVTLAVPSLLVLATMKEAPGHKGCADADGVRDCTGDRPRLGQDAALGYIRQAAGKAGHPA